MTVTAYRVRPAQSAHLESTSWAESGRANSCSWKKGWTGSELRAGRTQDPDGMALDDKEWCKLAAGTWGSNMRFWVSSQASGAWLWFDTGKESAFGQASTGWRMRAGRWDSETGSFWRRHSPRDFEWDPKVVVHCQNNYMKLILNLRVLG